MYIFKISTTAISKIIKLFMLCVFKLEKKKEKERNDADIDIWYPVITNRSQQWIHKENLHPS